MGGEIMKYLYLIFRLFKCSHKWVEINRYSVQYKGTGYYSFEFGEFGTKFIVNKCRKCGKVKAMEV